MTAARTIASAIEKLEGLRDATPVGGCEWVRASEEDARADVVVTTCEGDWIIRDGTMNFADADLIVTLHRTIDAQRAVLSRARANEKVRGTSGWCEPIWTLGMELAEAILGEDVS